MIEIPDTLKNNDFSFCLVKPKTKIAFEKGWQHKGYGFDNERLHKHLKENGNYGVICGFKNLRVIDIDDPEKAQDLVLRLKDLSTLTIRTGRKGYHFYIYSEYDKNHKLKGDVGEFRSKNAYVIAPNSIHENGNEYLIEKDNDIKKLSKEKTEEVLKGYIGIEEEQKEFFEIKKATDKTRSGREFGIVCKLIGEGKTKKEVFKEMMVYDKWANSPQQYREATYQKANVKVGQDDVGDPEEKHIRYLEDPKLWDLINNELDKKIEGEYEARRSVFFTFNMRNVQNLNRATDNLMVNDPSGTGKDYVVSSIFKILPDSEAVKRERISPKVLVYLNDTKVNPKGWTKKALYLEDLPNVVLNDDAFKVMSSAESNGISQTSIVVKNIIKNIDIRGKPSIVITIASSSPKPELLRRYPICNLTGSEEQTKAVLRKQGRFAQRGQIPEYNEEITEALKYLKRVKVSIPYAEKIADIFPSGNVIARTHLPRFYDYIKSSVALFQYQRRVDDDLYIAQEEDYEIARKILANTTTNQFMIPLTKPQQMILDIMSKKIGFFTVQELEPELSKIGISDRWARKQLDKLVEYGFLNKDNQKREDSFKPYVVYAYINHHKIKLPSYKEFESSSNTTNGSKTVHIEKTTYTTNTSNGGGK